VFAYLSQYIASLGLVLVRSVHIEHESSGTPTSFICLLLLTCVHGLGCNPQRIAAGQCRFWGLDHNRLLLASRIQKESFASIWWSNLEKGVFNDPLYTVRHMNKTHQDRWIIDYVSSCKETSNDKSEINSVRNAKYAKKIHLVYMVTNQENHSWHNINVACAQ